MKSKLIHADRQQTWALVFDDGDDVVEGLRSFAREHAVSAAQLTGIGALSTVTLGWFDPERGRYEPIVIDEQVEVLTLAGDVALADGEPQVHAHLAVGRRDGTAHGGHLLEGRVRPTLEVILVESPAHLRKRMDRRFGVALIDLED